MLQVVWARLARFGQLRLKSDPDIHFPKYWNELNDHKGQKNIHYTIVKNTLRKHAYSNTLKILPPKNENFQIKKLIFFTLLLKI